MSTSTRKLTQGLSLLELMIALLIGSILLLGVIQVFSASRTAYQLSQGVARVQENARFAMDYLQRDIRMVGHFGCVNDQGRLQTAGSLNSHLSTADNPFNFAISVQGYEASTTAPGQDINLAGPAGGWAPALPTYISELNPLPGSDIIMLRFLDSDGVPVTGLAADQVTVEDGKWDVLTRDGVANPALFGVADCTYTDVFQANTINAGAGIVTTSPSAGLSTGSPDFAGRFAASPAGQTMMYRAESLAYYVGTGASGEPALFRARFGTAPGGAAPIGNPEELVEGIENLQLVYGQDQGAVDALTGNINNFVTAATLGSAVANEAQWRRVGQVKIGIVARSPEPAASAQAEPGTLRALGIRYAAPNDSLYRSSYESAVALRNRLYGN